MLKTIIQATNSNLICQPSLKAVCCFHSSPPLSAWAGDPDKKRHWFEYNDKIYPPQAIDEPRRPAFVCHAKFNFKYSYKKLWYIACLVRGLSIDEALKQLSFVMKKGSAMVKETLLEAQELALAEHNVEFKSNLWVSESFVGKGVVVKGLRRHARDRIGHIRYNYTHYYCTLEEGKPPADYYFYRRQKSGEELFENWVKEMRNRKIINTL